MTVGTGTINQNTGVIAIPLDDLTLDTKLQVREATREQTVKDYSELMQEGTQFPPVDVVHDPSTGTIWLAHGWHRALAAKEAGFDTIDALVHEGTWRDAFRLACAGNAKNALYWPRAEKQKALRQWLDDQELSKMSNREIAAVFGISHSTVSRERTVKYGTDDAPVQRVGSDGKTYTYSAPATKTYAANDDIGDDGGENEALDDLYGEGDVPFEVPVAQNSTFNATTPRTFSSPSLPSYNSGSTNNAPVLANPAPVEEIVDMAVTWVVKGGEFGEYESSKPTPLPYSVRLMLKQLSGL